MLSNSCRYGIRAVIYLASQPESDGKTGIRQISRDLDLPTPFLAKILQQLAKQKILSSTKGPHGGFSILKDPQTITLYDIVKIIDGDEVFTNCIMHNGPCISVDDTKKPCPLHDDYSKTRNDRINLFRGKTIYDLAERVDKADLFTI
jgi:Rrf2 family transcriptional regulator, iron-sulfur cluster assembly transcription factor